MTQTATLNFMESTYGGDGILFHGKTIASLPAFARYPDKIRARACIPLYRVDKDGNKIEA